MRVGRFSWALSVAVQLAVASSGLGRPGPRQRSRAPMGARLWTASWTLARTQGPADCPCGPKTGPRISRWQRNK